MNDKLFEELLEAVQEGGNILRGDIEPTRSFTFDEPDVAEIRRKYHLTQSHFASLLGISVATLRNWEQGRRRPEGAAKVLLRVADRHPETLLELAKASGKDAS